MASSLTHIFQDISEIDQHDEYPLDSWRPPQQADMDMRIDSHGDWWHEGEKITRLRLVQWLARLLAFEEQQFWLKSPAIRYRIDVEEHPFIGVEWRQQDDNLYLRTAIEQSVCVNKEHPILVRDGEQIPVVTIRPGVFAKLSRNTYYDLLNYGRWHNNSLEISSGGEHFRLRAE